MKKIIILSLILTMNLALIADAVTVNREIKPEDLEKIYQTVTTPIVRSDSTDYTISDVRNRALLYAKKQSKLTQEEIINPANDVCFFIRELMSMGAEDVKVENYFFPAKQDETTSIKLGGRTFHNPKQCTEILYTFKGKPYKTAWCRSNRPHAKTVYN